MHTLEVFTCVHEFDADTFTFIETGTAWQQSCLSAGGSRRGSGNSKRSSWRTIEQ